MLRFKPLFTINLLYIFRLKILFHNRVSDWRLIVHMYLTNIRKINSSVVTPRISVHGHIRTDSHLLYVSVLECNERVFPLRWLFSWLTMKESNPYKTGCGDRVSYFKCPKFLWMSWIENYKEIFGFKQDISRSQETKVFNFHRQER